MKRLISVKNFVIVILLTTLVYNRTVLHQNIERLANDLQFFVQAERVLNLAAELNTAIINAETGQRGFLLTGDEEFLGPFETASEIAAQRLRELQAEAADSPVDRGRVAQLSSLVAERLASLQAGIALRQRNEGLPRAWIASQQGQQQMDAIRGLVFEIQKDEFLRLDAHQARSLAIRDSAVLTNYVTGAVATMIIIASGIWIGRSMAARQKAADVIQRAHQKLQAEMHERGRVEQALRESERIYRAIGESLNYGIWLCDAEGRNTYASSSFLQLVGLTQEQCSEFGWAQVLDPEDAQRAVAAWKECVRAGGRWDREERIRDRAGEWHPVLVRGGPVRDENGRLLCWAGITLDISQLKRAERELQEAHDDLERRIAVRTVELTHVNEKLQREAHEHSLAEQRLRERAEEKEVLLKEVHHRVKNNLQVISSLLYLQSQQTSDEGSVAMFSESQQRVRSMALVHERLYRSPDLAQVDFAEYIVSLTNSLFGSNRVDSDRIRMVVDVREVKLSVDSAVPCGLLVNELISNCLKHAFVGREWGCIQVMLRKVTDTEVMLSVSDDGCGLPPHINPESATTFGMQVVMALVEQLHGCIHVIRNGGTDFRVRFSTVR